MKAILLAILIGVVIFVSCGTSLMQSECACDSVAVSVLIINERGVEIFVDSIKYKFNNDSVQTIKADEDGNLFGHVGSHPGDYTIWAYHQGNVSDSINVTVGMGGPEGCRRPSTKEARIIFKDNEYDSYELKKIGSCGE